MSKSSIVSISTLVPRNRLVRRPAIGARRCLTLGLALLAAGCSSSTVTEQVSVSSQFYGTVFAEETQAGIAGRDILLAGGMAGDAAAAIGAALSLSLPSRAGLGGGGICLAQSDRRDVEMIDFLPRPAAGSALQIPGMVRGLAALQARYGTLRWQQVLAPAERLAALGVKAGPTLLADMRRAGLTMNGAGGGPLKEGDILRQEGTAAILAGIRLNGASDFYTGALAKRLVQAGLPGTDLAAFVPTWQPPLMIAANGASATLPASSAGVMQKAVWQALEADRDRAADPAQRLTLAHATGAQVLTSLAQGATVDAASDAGSTGFVVIDAHGGAVACSLTLGGLFGSGQTIGGLDILAARPVTAQSVEALSLAPVIITTRDKKDLVAAVVANGSPAAAVDEASALYAALAARRTVPFADAVAAPRSAEDKPSPATAVADRISGLVCPDGFFGDATTCSTARDPRGSGIILQAVREK
ncbi:MAG TPA: gamma-glutamyltransferase [Stellaceae bacterium]|nr:gamma-glutamyltransferase [Stellaceae bacterium]